MAVDTTVRVVMPAMGESVSEGTVLQWHKREGDPVSADETIVEVSTDKVDAEVPAPAAGTLTKILAPEGETVTVGQALAEIATDGVEAGQAEPGAQAGDGDGGPNGSRGAPAPPTEAPAPAEVDCRVVEIVMPAMGESVTECMVVEWHKSAGYAVAAYDTVVEVSTDKDNA